MGLRTSSTQLRLLLQEAACRGRRGRGGSGGSWQSCGGSSGAWLSLSHDTAGAQTEPRFADPMAPLPGSLSVAAAAEHFLAPGILEVS